MILLPASDPFFNRGPHLPVVIAVIFFAPIHVFDDLSINFGPEIVGNRVLLLHIIAAQNTLFFQLGKRTNDLLKGAVDDNHVSYIAALLSCNSMFRNLFI
jgi:hypothetical protein